MGHLAHQASPQKRGPYSGLGAPTRVQRGTRLQDMLGLSVTRHPGLALRERVHASDCSAAERARSNGLRRLGPRRLRLRHRPPPHPPPRLQCQRAPPRACYVPLCRGPPEAAGRREVEHRAPSPHSPTTVPVWRAASLLQAPGPVWRTRRS
jgi:hypothetical protein